MKKISLPNRHKERNYLEEVSPNKYKLVTSDSFRLGYNQTHDFTFVDPSGGPFMEIGCRVEGVDGSLSKIESDSNGTFLIFDKDDLSSDSQTGAVQQ